jgi:hypothetical protein
VSNYVSVPIQVNATLRRDEWKLLDDAVLRISEKRLGGYRDLLNQNLVYNLGNAMGTMVLETHTMSDALEAVATMDGVNRSAQDRLTYQFRYMPIPIVHSDFEISARILEASRKLGNPLDVDSVERGTRRVWERLETWLFTNDAYAAGDKGEDNRNSIYGYLNHPDRNLKTLTGAWTGLTGAQILTDVLDMKQESINAYHFGPWNLYVPTAYETLLDADYDTTTSTGRTIRERIKQIEGIKEVKTADFMTAGNVVLVEMDTQTVRAVNGMQVQVVQWKSEGQFVNHFKVITIQVPQVRSDQNGRSGIVHGSV